MIFIIDDDRIMAECIARSCKGGTRIFSNAIDAMNAIDDELPELIFLDILLDGPDGFTFLEELNSYSDTVKIPIVVVTSLNIKPQTLINYGVRRILDKTTMTPDDIRKEVLNVQK
ncbi:response regulator [Candidatus Saccharibacteria bacterium]|nr:response regulator [Candidatus Saccharibacteria bacterium]